MKTTKILNATFLLAAMGTSYVYAQKTTEEEYNYVTVGYKVQLESGLDKIGYIIKELFAGEEMEFTNKKYTVSFKSLLRDTETKPCAIILCVATTQVKSADKESTEYFCIPTVDADEALWGRTLDQINNKRTTDKDSVKDIYQAMIWALLKLSSQEIAK